MGLSLRFAPQCLEFDFHPLYSPGTMCAAMYELLGWFWTQASNNLLVHMENEECIHHGWNSKLILYGCKGDQYFPVKPLYVISLLMNSLSFSQKKKKKKKVWNGNIPLWYVAYLYSLSPWDRLQYQIPSLLFFQIPWVP